MPLDLQISGATSTLPRIVKYNAKTGQWLLPSSEKDSPDRVIESIKIALDFHNLVQNYYHFGSNGAKSTPLMLEGVRQERPLAMDGVEWRNGTECLAYIFNEIDSKAIGVKRWRGNSNAHNEAVDSAYTSWEADKDFSGEKQASQVPVFECKPRSMKHKFGVSWVPDLRRIDSVDRADIGLDQDEVVNPWLDLASRDDLAKGNDDIPF